MLVYFNLEAISKIRIRTYSQFERPSERLFQPGGKSRTAYSPGFHISTPLNVTLNLFLRWLLIEKLQAHLS